MRLESPDLISAGSDDHINASPMMASLQEQTPVESKTAFKHEYIKVTAYTGGEKLPLEPGKPIAIGRTRQPNLPDCVSRDHGTLLISIDGQIEYRDHSSNGTFIRPPDAVKFNEVHNQSVQLKFGSEIRLGSAAGAPLQITMERITPVTGYVGGEELPLGPGSAPVQIGRDFQSRITNLKVSRNHLTVRWTAGKVEIDDHSANGTYLKRQGESEFSRFNDSTVVVSPGDQIRLGEVDGPPLHLKSAQIRFMQLEVHATSNQPSNECSTEDAVSKVDIATEQWVGNKYRNPDGTLRQEDIIWKSSDNTVKVVCDGAGRHGDGQVAALIGVDTIKKEYATNYPANGTVFAVRQWMKNAIERANASVIAVRAGGIYTTVDGLLLSGNRLMASTILMSAATVDPNIHVLGWAGDSRAYVERRDSLLQLTHDDSPPWSPHLITNALGILSMAHIETIAVEIGDRFILSTDGLEAISPEEILASLRSSKNSQEAVQKLIRAVQKKNLDRQDNVSVIVYQAK